MGGRQSAQEIPEGAFWDKETQEGVNCFSFVLCHIGGNQARNSGKMDCQDKKALCVNKDMAYDLQLEKFDLDVDAIVKTLTRPIRILRC